MMPRDALVARLRMVINSAYTGSAEHGSFLRHGGGEMTPNAFLVLEDVEAALAAQVSSPQEAPMNMNNWTDAKVRELIGFLSAEIPELHQVEVPRLIAALDAFALAGGSGASSRQEPCEISRHRSWCLTHHCYPATCEKIGASSPNEYCPTCGEYHELSTAGCPSAQSSPSEEKECEAVLRALGNC